MVMSIKTLAVAKMLLIKIPPLLENMCSKAQRVRAPIAIPITVPLAGSEWPAATITYVPKATALPERFPSTMNRMP
jgi:hypothetical protein